MITGKDTSLLTWRDKRELRNNHTQVYKSICKSKGQEARYEGE
jgi:hypothetical protein